jgi:hypothetical protein
MNRMPGSPIPGDSTSPSESDELRPAQRHLLRSLLVEHAREDLRRAPGRAGRRRLAAAAGGFAAVAGVAAIAVAVVVTGVPLLPGGGSPAGPGPVTVAPSPTASPAPTPPPSTPTTPSDEEGAGSDGTGTGTGTGTESTLTAQTAYDLCVAAPDPWDTDRTTPDGTLIPAAPTTSTASFADSQVTEYVPGTWTVVIPVQRAHTDRAPEGIKVCTVSGPPADPAVTVTDALD